MIQASLNFIPAPSPNIYPTFASSFSIMLLTPNPNSNLNLTLCSPPQYQALSIFTSSPPFLSKRANPYELPDTLIKKQKPSSPVFQINNPAYPNAFHGNNGYLLHPIFPNTIPKFDSGIFSVVNYPISSVPNLQIGQLQLRLATVPEMATRMIGFKNDHIQATSFNNPSSSQFENNRICPFEFNFPSNYGAILTENNPTSFKNEAISISSDAICQNETEERIRIGVDPQKYQKDIGMLSKDFSSPDQLEIREQPSFVGKSMRSKILICEKNTKSKKGTTEISEESLTNSVADSETSSQKQDLVDEDEGLFLIPEIRIPSFFPEGQMVFEPTKETFLNTVRESMKTIQQETEIKQNIEIKLNDLAKIPPFRSKKDCTNKRKPKLKWNPNTILNSDFCKLVDELELFVKVPVSDEKVIKLLIRNGNNTTKVLELVKGSMREYSRLFSLQKLNK